MGFIGVWNAGTWGKGAKVIFLYGLGLLGVVLGLVGGSGSIFMKASFDELKRIDPESGRIVKFNVPRC